jgi:inner membrane transporter RhtA
MPEPTTVAPTAAIPTGTAAPRHRAAAAVDEVPPQLYFLVSAVFHYLGPAFAVLLFARVDVLGVARLGIASAAAVLALWRRPWRAFAAQDRDRVGVALQRPPATPA